jgi:GNAT superfamily N-acetyltransferase
LATRGGELEDLFVEPVAMRRGIGRALVDDAARCGSRLGLTHLHVVAHPRTLRFYARAGFETTATASTRFGRVLRLTRTVSRSRT